MISHIDLTSRLDMALLSALNAHVYVEDPNLIRMAQRGILNGLVRDQDDDDTISHPAYEEFYALTFPVIETPQGAALNTIWMNPAFLKPVVAATAQLWERIIRFDGDSLMTLRLSRVSSSLTGFRLDRLEAQPFRQTDGVFQGGDLDDKEYLRISTLLAAAARFIISDRSGSFIRAAQNYLITETARGGDRTDTDHANRSSGFITVETA